MDFSVSGTNLHMTIVLSGPGFKLVVKRFSFSLNILPRKMVEEQRKLEMIRKERGKYYKYNS